MQDVVKNWEGPGMISYIIYFLLETFSRKKIPLLQKPVPKQKRLFEA
jgi:hypothetical protein